MQKLLFLILLFLLGACQPLAQAGHGVTGAQNATAVPPTTPLFTNVSRQAGIVHTRNSNHRAIGLAWGDYNRDGWVDFYVTDPQGPNTLFRNNGDGTFSVSPFTASVALPKGYSGGASFADYDNDGWPDLYVVNWGANALFHNQQGQGFVDVTTQAGVGDEANGQTASWGDYDNDGYLDLYVANWACYPRCGRPSQGDSDRLYHNNGDGTFRDVTHLLRGHVYGAGFVATFTDTDNDGDLDIYLVNDEFLFPVGNKLWRNDGPGCGDGDITGHCFTEVSAAAGANTMVMGMGLAATDYDNDGDVDFYFSNAGPMTLLQNQGDGTFEDVATAAGVDLPDGIAWGTVALDYDNDGWQDLYLAVMMMADHTKLAVSPLYHNNGDGTFTQIRSGSGVSDVGPTMSAATADFDNDGWVDLLIGNKDAGYSLLRNQSGDHSDNHWLALTPVGGGPVNRDAVGARVTVRTSDGNVQMREVQNGSSLGAGNDLTLHFGLGTAATIAELSVTWPNGRTQQFANVPANQRVTLPYPVDAAAEAAQRTALYAARIAPATAVPPTLPWPLLVAFAATAVLLTIALTHRPHLTVSWPPFRASLTVILLLALFGGLVAWLGNGRQPNQAIHPTHLLPQRLPAAPEAQVRLGEALFWDRLLSGNQDTSCATCHHPKLATGDGLSLPIGTGGQGFGPTRDFLPTTRRVLVPRNATPLFNLGLAGMDTMFWDGRAQGTAVTEFASPADDDLPYGLDNAIAVQAMFPVTSREEMRGFRGDVDVFSERNALAGINDHDWPAMWHTLMARLLALPEYQALFAAAYPGVPMQELSFAHAANALAAYQMDTFTFLDSPWDRYLQGDEAALSSEALAGAELFYGKAGCADCHRGPLLSDMQFYNLGVPQIGPGKAPHEPYDYGRARETGDDADLFAFRTPPLRNVAITGPWMHNGAYLTLEAAVRHHLDPAAAVAAYDLSQLSPLLLGEDSGDTAVHTAPLSAPSLMALRTELSDAEVAALLAFLEALTSPSATDLAHTIPDSVPSGLPVDDFDS